MARDDQDPAVHPQNPDGVAVQLGQHVAADDLVDAAGRGPPAGHVDDPVHHRQQRVHVVRGEQHGDLLGPGHPGRQLHDLLARAQVQVGQRLVHQQQLRPADQGVRDQHPLRLAAGEGADALVGEARGADGFEHLLDQLAAWTRGQPGAEPVPVEAERHEVAGAQRGVRLDLHLLRHVADRAAAPGGRAAVDQDPALVRPSQTHDDAQDRRLALAVGPDQAGELAGGEAEADAVEDLPAAEPDAHVLQGQDLGGFSHGAPHSGIREEDRGSSGQSVGAERPAPIASLRALISASIHFW